MVGDITSDLDPTLYTTAVADKLRTRERLSLLVRATVPIFAGSAAAYIVVSSKVKRAIAEIKSLTPGTGTPGIYACLDKEQALVQNVATPTGILVRGTVYMWGDTIEQTSGIKSQYAYPEAIHDFACINCQKWLTIRGHDESNGPPQHQHCRSMPAVQESWQPPGLRHLRLKAPHWFD